MTTRRNLVVIFIYKTVDFGYNDCMRRILMSTLLIIFLNGCTNSKVTNSMFYPYSITVTGSYSHTKNSAISPIEVNGAGVSVGLTWKLKKQHVEVDNNDE